MCWLLLPLPPAAERWGERLGEGADEIQGYGSHALAGRHAGVALRQRELSSATKRSVLSAMNGSQKLAPLPEDWNKALAVVAHPDDLEYGAARAISARVSFFEAISEQNTPGQYGGCLALQF